MTDQTQIPDHQIHHQNTGGQRIKTAPIFDQTLSFLARFSGLGFVNFLMSMLYNLLSGQPRPSGRPRPSRRLWPSRRLRPSTWSRPCRWPRSSRQLRPSIDGSGRPDGRSRPDSQNTGKVPFKKLPVKKLSSWKLHFLSRFLQ